MILGNISLNENDDYLHTGQQELTDEQRDRVLSKLNIDSERGLIYRKETVLFEDLNGIGDKVGSGNSYNIPLSESWRDFDELWFHNDVFYHVTTPVSIRPIYRVVSVEDLKRCVDTGTSAIAISMSNGSGVHDEYVNIQYNSTNTNLAIIVGATVVTKVVGVKYSNSINYITPSIASTGINVLDNDYTIISDKPTSINITKTDGVGYIKFTAGESLSITLPEGSTWINNITPTFTLDKEYIITYKFNIFSLDGLNNGSTGGGSVNTVNSISPDENGNVTLGANDIDFSDGKSYQEKYDAGELTGPKGDPGENGIDGVTFSPVLERPTDTSIKFSYTNDSELPNPDPVTIDMGGGVIYKQETVLFESVDGVGNTNDSSSGISIPLSEMWKNFDEIGFYNTVYYIAASTSYPRPIYRLVSIEDIQQCIDLKDPYTAISTCWGRSTSDDHCDIQYTSTDNNLVINLRKTKVFKIVGIRYTDQGGGTGGGSVNTVNSINPDENGNIVLGANDIDFSDGKSYQEKYDAGELDGPKGDPGEQGLPFTYDDFTLEQLEALKGPKGDPGIQGEQGDPGEQGLPFTYDDFTYEQLEALKGPKGDPGEMGAPGEDFRYDDFTPDQLNALTGPQGEKGDPGEQGIPGEKGDPGKDFTYESFTPEQLEALKGPKGDPGEAGESGQAVQSSYTASEAATTGILMPDNTIISIDGLLETARVNDVSGISMLSFVAGENVTFMLPDGCGWDGSYLPGFIPPVFIPNRFYIVTCVMGTFYADGGR